MVSGSYWGEVENQLMRGGDWLKILGHGRDRPVSLGCRPEQFYLDNWCFDYSGCYKLAGISGEAGEKAMA